MMDETSPPAEGLQELRRCALECIVVALASAALSMLAVLGITLLGA